MLVSFATPCQSNDLSTKCLLRFTTHQCRQLAWSTVSLDIAADGNLQRKLNNTEILTDGSVSGTSDIHNAAQEPPLTCLHDELVKLSENHCENAKLHVFSDRRSWAVAPEPADSHQNDSMVPLASLNTESATHPISETPYEQRVSLALLVAYAFLQLGHSPWFPYATDSINVWFRQADGQAPVLLQPYFEVCLEAGNDELGGQSSGSSMFRMINPNMQSLPMLGKLILELISGTSIELSGMEKFMVRYRQQYPERAPYLWRVVKSCFYEPAFKGDVIHGNEILRTKFLEDIIYRLNKLLEQCKSTLEEEIAKMPLYPASRSVSSRKRRLSSGADTRLAKRSPTASFEHWGRWNTTDSRRRYCLHDDGSRRNYDTDQ